MKLLNYNFSILAIVILLTGCIYGDIDKRQRDSITIEAARYCEANHYSYCEIYIQCYRDFLDQINAGSYYSLDLMLPLSAIQDLDNKQDSKKAMDKIYANLKDNEKKDRKDLSLDDSYLLFPHNRCSSIINAKPYDISNYQEAIQQKIIRNKLNNK
ncbi:hypothetical protein DKK76_04435 [Frischella perrara]|uniref:Lipoprotein n=1 Tax=Frischella perrara TaxID=1267021 RepID=A0A318MYN4_FRIPE|nr:hypothetical protein [Frischella perrara]PXY96143.1 hypothetical protein DKK76_04435 [Frischella perrara]